jgi:hypothetical protein
MAPSIKDLELGVGGMAPISEHGKNELMRRFRIPTEIGDSIQVLNGNARGFYLKKDQVLISVRPDSIAAEAIVGVNDDLLEAPKV